MSAAASRQSISFGPFEFDAASGLLYRGQHEILLPLRAGKVLGVFLRQPGEVLSKDELLGEVWRDAFVGEDSLTQAISMIRSALGDDPRDPTYVQTIPKRGYRFIAEVIVEPSAEEDRPDEPVATIPAKAAIGAGGRLGHYAILDELGSGAMGVVYRARDTVLEREVAIKLLPEDFVSDPGRVARFEREAKLLAAVSHPNIAAIYSLEETDGSKFPVMELVEGETLEQKLRSGPINVDEALEISRQIASALEAAHDRGIIHRDLKPANIKLTPAGQVKVLDFGLAKALNVEVFGGGISESPTESITIMGSRRGSIVGTAAYMSPEQARGQDVNKQADIWAFGCVLYEMLTGRRPFVGDTVSDTIAGVLEREPDWEALPAGIPRPARRALRRCLSKDSQSRLHDVADVSIEIVGAINEPEEVLPAIAPVVAPAPRWRRAMPWGASIAVGAIVAGLAVWSELRPLAPPAESVRSVVPIEPGHRLWGGHRWERTSWALERPSRTAMALSPDGRHLVYSATDGREAQLYRRAMDQERATGLSDTEGGCCPFFSPDGQSIGFFAVGETGWSMKSLPLSGGGARTIVPHVQIPFGASWGDDGTIVFVDGVEGRLLRVSALGGAPEPLTEVDRENGEIGHRFPHLLPGGEAMLFTVVRGDTRCDDADIAVQSLETGRQHVLIERGVDPHYVPTGHLVFTREGTLMAVPFDPVRLEVTGEPVPVQEDVLQACYAGNSEVDTGAAQVSFSASGLFVFAPGGVIPELGAPLVWVDHNGEPAVLDLGPGDFWAPRISPDGQYVAYMKGHLSQLELWVLDIQRETQERRTFHGGNLRPVWSPDGKRIAFSSDKDGSVTNLYMIAADGSEEPTRLDVSDCHQFASSWSPDGELAFVSEEAGNYDIWVLPMEGEVAGEPQVFLDSSFRESHPTFHPEGKWLAYSSDETGRLEVYVRPFPGPDEAIRISTEGGGSPAWSRDGRKLYYRESAVKMMVVDVDVTSGGEFERGSPRLLFEGLYQGTSNTRFYDVTSEGRFLMVSWPQPVPQPITQINLVYGWFEELKRLVPAER